MKLRFLLAALPFLGVYAGGTLAAHRPLLFGMPFLLSWNLIWMVAAAAILAVMHGLDSRDEASAPAATGARQ